MSGRLRSNVLRWFVVLAIPLLAWTGETKAQPCMGGGGARPQNRPPMPPSNRQSPSYGNSQVAMQQYALWAAMQIQLQQQQLQLQQQQPQQQKLQIRQNPQEKGQGQLQQLRLK